MPRLLHLILTCLLFAIIFVAQIAGFLGVYRLLLVIPAALVVFGIALATTRQFRIVDAGVLSRKFVPVLVAVGIVFAALIVVRLLLYPRSELGKFLPSDLIGYHATKAIELLRSGSMWDLSIVYGDYPNGFEALLALSIGMTGTVASVSIVHLVVVLWLMLTLVLLLRRYGVGVLVAWCAAMGICFLPFVYSAVVMVGKNDLLVATAVLVGLLYAPIDLRNAETRWNPVLVAMATLIAVSTKANGALMLAVVWLWILAAWANAARRGVGRDFLSWRTFTVCVLIMLPSVLWLVRNVIVMGKLFSPEVSAFSSTSFLANWRNPLVYNSGAETQLLFIVIVATVVILALLFALKRLTLSMFVVAASWWVAFLATPLSAFHTPDSLVLHIEWRYALHLWLLLLVLTIVIVAPLTQQVLDRITQWRLAVLALNSGAVGTLVVVMALFWQQRAFMLTPAQGMIFQFPSRVIAGTSGYANVYEYVQQNIHHARIWYDIAEHYYLYDAAMTNQPNAGYKYPLGMPEASPYFAPDYAVVSVRYGLRDELLRLGRTYVWREVYRDDGYVVYERQD